ncbi:MAG: methyltransferase, partial [Myxococcota bacterium]
MIIHTEDAILGGAVRVLQPRAGYRFSVDAVQLAAFAFARAPAPRRALDLGCGTGVVAFILAHRAPRARLVGVEIQPALAALARAGADRNGFADRVTILAGDMQRPHGEIPRGAFDLVVANPPYHAPGRGRTSPEPSRARAHHEIDVALPDARAAASAACAPRGRIAL